MHIPGSADVANAARTLMPSSKRALPIADTAADPGLFGPGSVTWRVMAEPVLMLGAGRALLMQAAHPLVAEGAIEHSTYASDPYGRLERTVEWVTAVCFGTTAEARRACRVVNRLHAEVEGAAGEIIDLPADRDSCDLAGEARQAPRQQKEQKGALLQQGSGAG